MQSKIQQLQTLRRLSHSFRKASPDSAILFATRTLCTSSENLSEDVEVITAEYLLGDLYTTQEKDTLAVFHLERGLDKARDHGNDSLITKGYVELANFYISKDSPRKSIQLLETCLGMTARKDNRQLGAELYTSMGDAYKSLGVSQTDTNIMAAFC